MTTNSIEGFHGLALKYRGKKVDLHHSHYICKTNMAIYHKVAAKERLYHLGRRCTQIGLLQRSTIPG